MDQRANYQHLSHEDLPPTRLNDGYGSCILKRRSMRLSPATRLGPYEIVSSIGAGGMGEVYRARDTRLDRIVAIKILPSGDAGCEEVRQRFEREARVVSSLNHPHICAL